VQSSPKTPSRAIKTGVAERKSRHRIQQWVHARQPQLADLLASASPSLGAFVGDGDIEWRSPLAARDYREFRDELWKELGLPGPSPQEAEFWPRNGPQWDAVAVVHGDGADGTLLVECKAWTGEAESRPAGSDISQQTQRKAFAEVQSHLRVSETDWLGTQFQLANRLAFLYYLRCRLGQPAWLVLVYFTGESERGGRPERFPSSAEQWKPSIDAGWRALGLTRGEHRLADSVIEVFLPVFERPIPVELARAVPEAVRSDITRYIAGSPAS
jgi:hypothetical protein